MGTRSISRRQLLAGLSLYPAARLLGQDPSFSTDVKVVNLFATVRDKKDAVVRGLTKDDFVLDEDGRPQVIRYFSQESNLPLIVGLLVDTSGSTREVLPDERRAAAQFLRQVLRPDQDRAFVIHFDVEAELLQDLTGSRERLEKALDELETGQLRRRVAAGSPGQAFQYPPGGSPFPYPGRRYPRYPGGGYPGGGYPGGGYPGGGYPRGGQGRGMRGGTVLYDAVYLGAGEIMRKQKGRKAFILLSDGEDNGSKTTLAEAIEAAQRADTLVYSIHFDGAGAGFGRRRGFGRVDGKQVMEDASRDTGGRYFEVTEKMPLDRIFALIEEDLRNQYSIGYSPEASAGGGYRHIHLTTKQKGLRVQAREGYYPS